VDQGEVITSHAKDDWNAIDPFRIDTSDGHAWLSYGSYWFPWYMRRLAERPANVLFVARSLLSR